MSFGLVQPLLNLGTHTLRDLDGSLGAIMPNAASIVGRTAGGINILHAKVRLLAPGALLAPTFHSAELSVGVVGTLARQAPSVLDLEPRKMGERGARDEEAYCLR